ncbi:Lipoprotein lipase [Orchesella cincta]|uniref:Lipoprotein lipase n=1 Tax=Orchesella cincta TaxID=48709 RepID=A0A1D2N143_ORCCI|nr:Lipoprotein lipase [Orchesella cincta]
MLCGFRFFTALLAIGLFTVSSEAKSSKIRFLIRDRLNDAFPPFPEDEAVSIPPEILWHFISTLKVIVSDYSTDPNKDAYQNLWDQNIIYLGKSLCHSNLTNNIIIADLSAITSTEVSKFADIIQSVHDAGRDLADFVIKMKENGHFLSWNNTQFIGLGIGAHVAAVAAQIIQKEKKEKIQRLTGLDPLSPGFIGGANKYKDDAVAITKDDAEFVKIIHCNMGNANTFDDAVKQGRFGSSVESGHVHIYANGGEQMPTCKQEYETPDRLCSHRKCAAFLANSMRQEVSPLACPCDNWESFSAGKCSCTKETGGIDVSYQTTLQASGKYYADVPEALLVTP